MWRPFLPSSGSPQPASFNLCTKLLTKANELRRSVGVYTRLFHFPVGIDEVRHIRVTIKALIKSLVPKSHLTHVSGSKPAKGVRKRPFWGTVAATAHLPPQQAKKRYPETGLHNQNITNALKTAFRYSSQRSNLAMRLWDQTFNKGQKMKNRRRQTHSLFSLWRPGQTRIKLKGPAVPTKN